MTLQLKPLHPVFVAEVSGIDLVVHAETAYDLHATAGTRTGGFLGHRE